MKNETINACEHKWVHKETIRKSKYDGWGTNFIKYDIYFCEKCLEERVVKKEESSRDVPDWY